MVNMKRFLPLLLLPFLMAASPETPSSDAVPAAAAAPAPVPQTVDVEGRSNVVVAPDGGCSYDRAQPQEAKILDTLEHNMNGVNKVLLAFAECRDLESFRAGKELNTGDYGQIMFPLDLKTLWDEPRGSFVRQMTDYYKANAGMFDETGKEFTEKSKSQQTGGPKINNTRIMGVIHDEADLLQIGLMQSMQKDDKAFFILGVTTITKLGVPVSINMYRQASGASNEKELHALSERAAAYARKLIALNPDSALIHADERSESPERRIGRFILLFAVLAMAGFVWRRKRKAKP